MAEVEPFVMEPGIAPDSGVAIPSLPENSPDRFLLGGANFRYWNQSAVEIDAKGLTENEADLLAGAVEDRFLLWSARDFTRQPRFDQAFAGVVLSDLPGDWIGLEEHYFDALKVRDGRKIGRAHV